VRVVVAPDKFKGSLRASGVVEAVAAGLRKVVPGVEIVGVPVADGGDGTVDAAIAAGFEPVVVHATGPTGEPVDTTYARRADTAVVELAAVVGLELLPGGRLDAMNATTFGLGTVLEHAIDHGARRIVLGVGGSASTDGGVGMLQAVGVRFLDETGHELARGGGALSQLGSVDLMGLDPRIRDVEVVVASDVDNPLCGPKGAAAVYGPQKGASPEEVGQLDQALRRLADAALAAGLPDVSDNAGAGAAGGTSFGAMAFLGARLEPGIQLLLDLIDFEAAIDGADLVITGEGSLDEQSLHGKVPIGVADASARHGVPVVAVAGRCLLSDDRLSDAGIRRAYPLSAIEPDPAASMRNAAALLETTAAQLARDWLT
jgi:glycerate kinase